MTESFSIVCDSYLQERDVTKLYGEHLKRVSRACGRITKESVNDYLRQRLNSVSSTTVSNERRMLLTLWRWAFENGLCDSMPRGILSVRPRTQPVRAWTIAEIAQAVNATFEKKETRLRNGASLGDWLECWLRLGYETGARWGDLWAMRESDFHGNMLRFTARKTGSHIHRVLSDDCIRAVSRMLEISTDGTVLGWVAKKRYAMRIMKEHLEGCGLKGTSKWLRRSGATHVEQQRPGQAKMFLGHRTAGLAERHYIDWAQMGGNSVTVPKLVACAGRP